MKPWELEREWLLRFGRRLRTLAHHRQMPLTELSRRSGVPYTTLYGYAVQGRRVPAYAAVRLAKALEVELSELLD